MRHHGMEPQGSGLWAPRTQMLPHVIGGGISSNYGDGSPSSDTTTIRAPAECRTGDRGIVIVCRRDGTTTPPTGWSSIGSQSATTPGRIIAEIQLSSGFPSRWQWPNSGSNQSLVYWWIRGSRNGFSVTDTTNTDTAPNISVTAGGPVLTIVVGANNSGNNNNLPTASFGGPNLGPSLQTHRITSALNSSNSVPEWSGSAGRTACGGVYAYRDGSSGTVTPGMTVTWSFSQTTRRIYTIAVLP